MDNPRCEAVGCGKWTPPLINNPLYKGKWSAPKIANPLYRGPWSPRQIPNPEYFKEENPYAHIAPMVGVSVEVWTTSAGILLDNILVSHSVNEAIAFSKLHTKPKTDAEIEQAKAEEKRIRERDRREAAEKGGFKGWAEAKVMDLVEYLNENPWALYTSVAAVVVPFFWALLFGGRNVKTDKADRASHGGSETQEAVRQSSSTGEELREGVKDNSVDSNDNAGKDE